MDGTAQSTRVSKAEAVKQQSRGLRGNLARRPRGHRNAVRQHWLQPPQVPRHLPGLRPRHRHRTQAARRQQAVAVHGAGAHPGRAADRRPVPGARRAGRPLRQRLAAGHDPAEHPVPRRPQTRAEGGDRRDRSGIADDVGGVRRCRAHRHDRAGAAAGPGAPPAGRRRPASVDAPAAEDRRLSRDLGRRREGHGGGRGVGPALWRALPAAQIQDRSGDPRGQHDRRLDQRSGDRRAVRGRDIAWLQFPARRRARRDPQQAGDLSAPRHPGRVCRARRPARRGGGGGAAASRFRRPRQSPPCPAQIRHRRTRRGLGARAPVRRFRQKAGAVPRHAGFPGARPSRLARAGRRPALSRRADRQRPHRRRRAHPHPHARCATSSPSSAATRS